MLLQEYGVFSIQNQSKCLQNNILLEVEIYSFFIVVIVGALGFVKSNPVSIIQICTFSMNKWR